MARRYNTAESFWSRVECLSSSECWLWRGATSSKGYGVVSWNGKDKFCHRLAWELSFGSIQEGLFICHKCDVRLCCNPQHLFSGTASDNQQDAALKGRMDRRPGSKHPLAILHERDVVEMRHRHSNGETAQELADTFNVAKITVYGILARRSWRHI